MKKLLIFLIFILPIALISRQALAQDCGSDIDCLDTEIDKLSSALEQSRAATTPLVAELNRLDTQLKNIQTGINKAKDDLRSLEASIAVREGDFAEQYALLSERVLSFYKNSRTPSGLIMLFGSSGGVSFFRDLFYEQTVTDRDKGEIEKISLELIQLEQDKQKAESDRARLADLQIKVDKEAEFFRTEIAGARAYQEQLSGRIATLTARQQSIIAARSGSFITSVGAVPIGSDFAGSIAGFNQEAPSGYFAVFSFGAYTHRNGMSQYGAKKQAENKGYKDIIQWYYGHGVKKDDGLPTTIDVQGEGTMDMQKYLYGIAEMPSDWNIEALKAQAVAARTYANRASKPICTSQSCQVFLKSKSESPPPEWKKAVDETEKEVVDGDVSAQYSSTTGGYLNTSGWDTTDRSNSGDWTTRAWESQAGSPWFYKSWYRQSYTNGSSDCGRKPWLSEVEMADILNAWLVLKKGEGGGVDTGRVVPVTINQCPIGGQSGEPYSMDELRSKLSNPVTSISGKPTATNNGSGSTTNVRFATNRGELNIPGAEFKEVFNTRAPGYISVPQSGFAFYNIERK